MLYQMAQSHACYLDYMHEIILVQTEMVYVFRINGFLNFPVTEVSSL
jgi:hypothetical protein